MLFSRIRCVAPEVMAVWTSSGVAANVVKFIDVYSSMGAGFL